VTKEPPREGFRGCLIAARMERFDPQHRGFLAQLSCWEPRRVLVEPCQRLARRSGIHRAANLVERDDLEVQIARSGLDVRRDVRRRWRRRWRWRA